MRAATLQQTTSITVPYLEHYPEQGGPAERVAVATGIRVSGRIEVTSGRGAGDRVVTAGTHKVAPGAPLRVAETTEPTAPKTATP